MISAFFDSIELRISNREFVTHTGLYRGMRLTAMSTGIGTDNIDIVLNELDALANIDLEKRVLRQDTRRLTFVRIGTTGGLQTDIPINSLILSRYAAGFDAVLNFYAGRNSIADLDMEEAFRRHTTWPSLLPDPSCPETTCNLRVLLVPARLVREDQHLHYLYSFVYPPFIVK